MSTHLSQNSYSGNLLSFLIMKDDCEKPCNGQNSEANDKKKVLTICLSFLVV